MQTDLRYSQNKDSEPRTHISRNHPSFHDTSSNANNRDRDIELAIRLPLPPSSLTVATAMNSDSSFHERQGIELEPVDRGRGAWSFVRYSAVSPDARSLKVTCISLQLPSSYKQSSGPFQTPMVYSYLFI